MKHEDAQVPPADAGRLETPVRQHTPGPWHATTADEWRTASGKHAQWGRFDISAGSKDIEAENYYRVASVSNVNNSDQNQANAKLIAKAPDMAAALDLIVRRLQMDVDDGSRPDQWTMEDLIRTAKAALPHGWVIGAA
jgi:hypothetical protein